MTSPDLSYPSIIIPARDEAGDICDTIAGVRKAFLEKSIEPEIIVVDDQCSDSTAEVVVGMSNQMGKLLLLSTKPDRSGIGNAIALGLSHFSGDSAIIMMADGSDRPEDAVTYYKKLREGNDCVFGTRFSLGGRCIDYPQPKLFLNRMANAFIRFIFGIRHDDITNAFKAYSRECIHGISPIISHHFNVTVEMPLKAIIRGYNYATVPIEWRNRKAGVSKLRIQEMGSRYLFICLYLWLEKKLSRGDYVRKLVLYKPNP
jgi:dolichol-phosphate mannosyltransferase